jgi:hypothetical protein
LSLVDLRLRLATLGPRTAVWVRGFREWVAADAVPALVAAPRVSRG